MPTTGQVGTVHDNDIGGKMIWKKQTKKNGAVRHLMIRMTKALLLAGLLLMLSPTHALAAHKASQASKKGDMAVSGNLGFADAFDGNFSGLQPVLTGTFEYYSSARVSWRGLLGFTSFDADRPRGADVDFMLLNGNVAYNWERGWIHPFVTGGVGLYSKDASSSLPSKSGDTVPGLNFGGGVDWFLGSRWALKFEGTLHALTGEKPNSFVMGTAGVKWWF